MCINYFKERNTSISQSNVNLIINKCNGDRRTLLNELGKLGLFLINKKKITTEEITKLINLSEDHDISILVDNCLAKNEKKNNEYFE